jgi:outer membrane lipoprotein carrier protein
MFVYRSTWFAAAWFAATLAALIAVCACPAFPAPKAVDAKLDTLLHGVEQRYNHAHTLSIRFTESYVAGTRTKQTESGMLQLRKPGRMRWDYAAPPGKFFLSDGKHFYLYTPTTKRVEVSSIRDTEDMHAPLAFLLGNLNFYKEFSGFSWYGDGPDMWVAAEPNSATLPYSKVEFLVTPESRIRRMRVTQDDLSILDFTFDDEKVNPPLDQKLFVFRLPVGAEIEDNSR